VLSFEFKLARRYVRTRRQSLVRFTSGVAVAGIAAGVASLIIAQAISKGFSDEMRDKVLSNTAHITIYLEGDNQISNWEIIKARIEKIENIETFEPTSYESAVISTANASSYAVLRVQSSESKVQGSESGVRLSMGRDLAEKLKLKIGDEAEIITLENEKTAKNSMVQITDIFETGLYEYDSTWVFADEKNYLKLKQLDKFSPKVFSVGVRDIYNVRETTDQIRQRLGTGFRVLDWQAANKPLFAALSLERKVSFAIIWLIIAIAVLNITTTLTLLVAERRLDIAVLRTCGAKTKSLVMIFLFEGIILSLTGIIAGVIIGLTVCLTGNYFRLISLSKEVYSLNHIPFRIDFLNVLIIIGLTFLLSVSAIVYPALKVTRIKPLENLRTL
jgi:lipoprotein-releasing system permease protein